jgi:hypothetical protein
LREDAGTGGQVTAEAVDDPRSEQRIGNDCENRPFEHRYLLSKGIVGGFELFVRVVVGVLRKPPFEDRTVVIGHRTDVSNPSPRTRHYRSTRYDATGRR